MTPENEKKSLLAYARAVLEEHLGRPSTGTNISPQVQSAPAGLFVTIYDHDEVRGSMGNVILHDALPRAIARLTVEAASQDVRLPALAEKDPAQLRLEISFLSPLKRVFHIEDIEPQRHGVYIHKGLHQGVLLPQVWKDLPERSDFLNALCRQKAGLPRGSWMDPEAEMYVFTVDTFSEGKP